MSANVTGGIGLHAADLLTTLKTGWLLGASPRVQFYAQLFGVVAGAAVVVPAFNILIPDPSVLGTDAWPAPTCLVWAGVSKAFAGGIGALDSLARAGHRGGPGAGRGAGAAGALRAAKRCAATCPRPRASASPWSCPGSNAIAMFGGALIALLVHARERRGRQALRGARGLGPDRGREPDGRGDRAADRGRRAAQVAGAV